MPHQCTKCSKVYPDASEELLNGCECGSKFFYYIREAKLVEMNDEVSRVMEELDRSDMDQIESDILKKESDRIVGNNDITRRLRDTYPVMIGVCQGEFMKSVKFEEVGELV